jgi:hydrogenase expression/formation protein HypE
MTVDEPAECISAQVLQGLKKPTDCPAFGMRCTPENPLGARWFQPKAHAPPTITIGAMRLRNRRERVHENRRRNKFRAQLPDAFAGSRHNLLGHGSGGKLSAELIRDIFLPAFQNPVLARLDDQAIVNVNGQRLAMTTDSFVVKPLFFPGGDIGSLAVHGTINDLAMGGATPLFLSAAFIIEEGFSMEDLRRVVNSLRHAAANAGVHVVTGDTKVVEKGKGDGLFINTTGIGLVPPGVDLSADRARPGDKVILSGSIGDHGIAILAQREGLEFETQIQSDSAALHTLVASDAGCDVGIRCMRDPTRGGVSSTLNEIAERSQVGIELEESSLPIHEQVRGACELLGLDPLICRERRQADRDRGARVCRRRTCRR